MPTHSDAPAASNPVTFDYEGAAITIDLPTSNEHMGRAICTHHTFYERDVLETCRELLRRERVPFAIVDVGAFCGNHATYFAKFCGAELVVACEPTTSSFGALTRTLATNGVTARVRACQTAVGDTIGRGTMVQAIADNTGGNVLSVGSGETPVTTVDHLLDTELPPGLRVALIKIDVEGGEVAVVRGARHTIESHRPMLCVELMTANDVRAALGALPVPYAITDLRGWSPTWLFHPVSRVDWRVRTVNAAWCALSALRAKPLAGLMRAFAGWLLRDHVVRP